MADERKKRELNMVIAEIRASMVSSGLDARSAEVSCEIDPTAVRGLHRFSRHSSSSPIKQRADRAQASSLEADTL